MPQKVQPQKNNFYGFPSALEKAPPLPIISQRAPTAADLGYEVGQTWVDQSENCCYILLKTSGGQAVWQLNTGTSTTSYIVGPSNLAKYQTIQSAVNDAVADGASVNSPKNIFIIPGTYSENVTVYDGINLVAYVGGIGLATFNAYPTRAQTVIIQGQLTINTENVNLDSSNSFYNISFFPLTGNVINYLSNPASYDTAYFCGCLFVTVDENQNVFNTDGYPTIILSTCSIIDEGDPGSNNNLLSLAADSPFFTLNAAQTIFYINTSSPCILPEDAYCIITLTSCIYQTMFDASVNTPVTLGLDISYSQLAWQGTLGVPLIDFGNETGYLILNNCYFNEATGPIVTSTSTNSYVIINNTDLNENTAANNIGAIVAPSTTITNSTYTFGSPHYSEVFKGIGTGFQGSQEIKGQAGIETTNNTQTTLASIVLSELQSVVFKGEVCAAQSNHTNAVIGNFTVGARRASGGNVTLVGSPIVNVESSSAATFSCDVDTTSQSVRLRVSGVAATTYNWVTTYCYFKVLTNS